MATQLTNNQTLIKGIVARQFSEASLFAEESTYFEFFSAREILKNFNLTDDEIIDGIVGSGNDGGCDALYVFVNDELITEDLLPSLSSSKNATIKLVIIQAKNELSFKEDALLKWKTVSENLLPIGSDYTDGQRYSEAIREHFSLFSSAVQNLISNRPKIYVSYHYVTLGTTLHPNVISQGEELKGVVTKIYPNATVTIEYIDADKLMCMFMSEPDTSSVLQLPDAPISLTNTDFVALVNIGNFYRFITDSENHLKTSYFESNVRDYQGQNDVNTCIGNTLANNVTDDFWWLNNGVTILASEIQLVTNKSLQISNPSIVNGLQTSREIYNYFSSNPSKLDNENRNVLLRIIKPNDEESRDRIIFATNNQTAIPKYSLRVTDNIHFQIEMYFKGKGLYYDRRKNYYRNQKKKNAEIVGVSFLAQCLISIILRKPDMARARPSTLLTEDSTYCALYSQNNDLESYYRCAKIGKAIENELRTYSGITQSEKSDIKFYVIYGFVVKALSNNTVSFSDLKTFDLSTLQQSSIMQMISKVYSVYKDNGGNSRIVKDHSFVDKIDDAILVE